MVKIEGGHLKEEIMAIIGFILGFVLYGFFLWLGQELFFGFKANSIPDWFNLISAIVGIGLPISIAIWIDDTFGKARVGIPDGFGKWHIEN